MKFRGENHHEITVVAPTRCQDSPRNETRLSVPGPDINDYLHRWFFGFELTI
jgi:hypothetical protein